MSVTTVQELLEAGVHFGSATSKWNPRMKPFIHGRRNKIHIIDLVHTVRGLARAGHFLEELAATGRQVVFVCTKRQMRVNLIQEATRAEMPWVAERWLGGTLTNFKTVRSRLARLEELEALDAAGQLDGMAKKAVASLNRERRRIKKNLDGLRALNRIPGALLVVDPKREDIAVAEAQRIGVPVVAILDTDCDPSVVDIPIPGNDDSMRSVTLLLNKLTDAVARGVQRFKQSGHAPEDALGVRDTEGQVEAIEPRRDVDEQGGVAPESGAGEGEDSLSPASGAPTREMGARPDRTGPRASQGGAGSVESPSPATAPQPETRA